MFFTRGGALPFEACPHIPTHPPTHPPPFWLWVLLFTHPLYHTPLYVHVEREEEEEEVEGGGGGKRSVSVV